MPTDSSALLTQAKQHLGPLRHLDYTALDTLSAHQRLGQDARPQIHKILARRLEQTGRPGAAAQIRQARLWQAGLRNRLASPRLGEAVRAALNEYLVCVSAWADGADLAHFRAPALPKMVDDLLVSPEDLAFVLQSDEVGCQTGAYRARDGSVILWHTEEDYEEFPGQRFDGLRLFSFRAAGGRISTGFIYPDLLPGPTFGWQAGDFIQAVDTLHIKDATFDHPLLPNILAWLSLYLGAEISRAELAGQLLPCPGGYALTALARQNGRPAVEKLDFANDQYAVSSLPAAPGSYLFQTNVIADLSQPLGAQEQTSPESRAWNEARLARTAGFMAEIRAADDPLAAIFAMLRSRAGDDSAYANHDVKAHLVCRMSPEQTSIWVGNGPAMPGDEPFTLTL